MNRDTLRQLEENFDAFVGPLLNDDDPEDVALAWEFRKFIHSKKLKILTVENENLKKWKQILLSR